MSKKFTKFEIAAIKRTAQNVSRYLVKRQKIEAKIAQLEEEMKELQQAINSWEAPIRNLTGYSTEELVIRKVDNTKNPPVTTFELIYGENVVPPVEEKEEQSTEDITNDSVSTVPEPINFI